jgi:hypothetical protein
LALRDCMRSRTDFPFLTSQSKRVYFRRSQMNFFRDQYFWNFSSLFSKAQASVIADARTPGSKHKKSGVSAASFPRI